MFSNKKSMELGINFIVVLIIAIVVFSMGTWMAFNFYKKANTMQNQVDVQTKNDLESMLAAGEKVAVPYNKETVRIGKMNVFGLGIKNVDSSPGQFIVHVEQSKYINTSQIETAAPQGSLEITYSTNSYTLKNNEMQIVPIAVAVKKTALPGTYVLNVQVLKGSAAYGTMQKIYVEVP